MEPSFRTGFYRGLAVTMKMTRLPVMIILLLLFHSDRVNKFILLSSGEIQFYW